MSVRMHWHRVQRHRQVQKTLPGEAEAGEHLTEILGE